MKIKTPNNKCSNHEETGPVTIISHLCSKNGPQLINEQKNLFFLVYRGLYCPVVWGLYIFFFNITITFYLLAAIPISVSTAWFCAHDGCTIASINSQVHVKNCVQQKLHCEILVGGRTPKESPGISQLAAN